MGYLEIFELLLKNGADYKIEADGETVESECSGKFKEVLDKYKK
jgi:hypothetical protein